MNLAFPLRAALAVLDTASNSVSRVLPRGELLRPFVRIAAPATAVAMAIGYLAASASSTARPLPPKESVQEERRPATQAPASQGASPEAPPAPPVSRSFPATTDATRAWLEAVGPAAEITEGRRLITLTFDDGPSLGFTPKIRKSLKQFEMPATFFVIGKYLEGDDYTPKMARKIVGDLAADGHLIGNHTLDHSRLSAMTMEEATRQIDHSSELIASVTGQVPAFFRPPYGEITPELSAHLAARNEQLVLWNMEAKDWESDDADAVFRELVRNIDNARGGIVLMHDWKASSAEVTQRLLAWLQANRWDPKHPGRAGYVVVDLPTFLTETAEHPQPYASRDELHAARIRRFLATHTLPTKAPAHEPPTANRETTKVATAGKGTHSSLRKVSTH